jgi:DNA-directed RNA polymerase sigma subunit (sigma70/sigma32)
MSKKSAQNTKININKSTKSLNNSEFSKKSKKDPLVNLLKNITEEDIFKEDLTFSNITTNKEEIYKKLKVGSFNNYSWLIDNYQRFKNIPLDLEREIIKDAKEGNYQAKILLISIIFPFIIKIYKSLIGKNLEYSEYISEGIAAALEAIERFDLNYNVRFSTYATYWIYHSLFKTNYNQDNLLKVPLSIYTEYQKIIKTKTFLENKYNRKVSLEEVIEYLFKDSITKELLQEENITPNDQIFKKRYRLKIKELVNKYSKVLKLSNYKIEISLQDFKYDEGNRTFEDYIENKIEECPENLFNKSYLKSKILEYINTYLDNEEKLLVVSSFGILDKRPLNLNELTDLYFTVYGKRLSKERIRQMLNKALIKLRKYIPKDIIELYS